MLSKIQLLQSLVLQRESEILMQQLFLKNSEGVLHAHQRNIEPLQQKLCEKDTIGSFHVCIRLIRWFHVCIVRRWQQCDIMTFVCIKSINDAWRICLMFFVSYVTRFV